MSRTGAAYIVIVNDIPDYAVHTDLDSAVRRAAHLYDHFAMTTIVIRIAEKSVARVKIFSHDAVEFNK